MMIKLGTKVRDIQTGFTGIAIGRTEYLNDVTIIGIQPPIGKDGKVPNITWFNEETRVVLVKAAKKKRVVVAKKKRKAVKKPRVRTTSRRYNYGLL